VTDDGPTEVRCAACGARNAPGAGWCTQCFAAFGSTAPDPAPRADGADVPDPASTVEADPGAGRGREVRVREGDQVEWRCRRCGSWSALEATACTTCGEQRHGFGDRTPVAAASPSASPTAALAASVVLPGLGHLLLGRPGTGLARLLTWLVWLPGGVVTVRATTGAGTLPGVVLLAGAAALWVATLLDTRALVAGRGDERLTARALAWLVAGVVLAAVAAVAVAATTAG
jgi:hypothetical protein